MARGDYNGRRISRCMSTQHPDNVRLPFFARSAVMEGEDEVREAFYVFSHLGIREQLWDFEGKEVDNSVVKKLLSNYEPYFNEHILGKDFFLTLRLPNPEVEKQEGKILLESLDSIPRSYDAARLFYQENVSPPVFEVALPMVTSADSVMKVWSYYKNFVIGKSDKTVWKDSTVKEWLGQFLPESIRVIPLIETYEAMLSADRIAADIINSAKPPEYQRIWLARSDPALNYGSLSAVLLNKIALSRLNRIEEELSIDILPILGSGSAPFRGNLRPDNYEKTMKGYPSVHTFTLQSAFKYDYDEHDVKDAVEGIETKSPNKAIGIDEDFLFSAIKKVRERFSEDIVELASVVEKISPFIPQRRKRKLHIGLFGYSRAASGVKLPRAIKFCASLYSLGIPPEIFGIGALKEREIDKIGEYYPSLDDDMKDALSFLNEHNMDMLSPNLRGEVDYVKGIFEHEINRGHEKVTSIIRKDLGRGNPQLIAENIERAGWIRGFLG